MEERQPNSLQTPVKQGSVVGLVMNRIKIGETILQLFKAAMIRSLKSGPQIALQDHRKILKALYARDGQQLREAIIKSFENWRMGLEEVAKHDHKK